MNNIWSPRIRWYSSAMGSLTLSTRSALSHTASAVSRIFAPAAVKSSSLMEEPSPAFRCTTTSWPALTSSRTPAGVAATRYSWIVTSVGTPILI